MLTSLLSSPLLSSAPLAPVRQPRGFRILRSRRSSSRSAVTFPVKPLDRDRSNRQETIPWIQVPDVTPPPCELWNPSLHFTSSIVGENL
ncbi:hypothetical protein F2P81_005668 [Scophthalmus maximus]|uniref:Uncharacterized protein n=1 Tax=Scophthalmus maximus TaxID=52904 RepID=A0A6A4T3R3_SCOMX|nr:hypothetical protein F2P81_005668 [Scophthalmus maximus]